jgi:hypothetical protein
MGGYSPWVMDDDAARTLWGVSEELVGTQIDV